MTIATKGTGAAIKGIGKRIKGKLGIKKKVRPGNIFSKYSKSEKKTSGEKHFDTVYKRDKTGKKDKQIRSMNKYLKQTGRSASPKMVERYQEIMTKDSQYSPKFLKSLEKAKDK